mgnify:CR=1 FL=1
MTRENDTISEKAKRIEISLKYTASDMEKAKLMASGKLQDVMVIKGKFAVADKSSSGMVLFFINTLYEYISAVRIVMCQNTSIFSSVRIFDGWKVLYKNLVAYEAGSDAVNSGSLSEQMLDGFISNDLFPDTQNKNLDFLSVAIQDMLKKSLESDKIKCQFDLEPASSLDVELAGISIMLPTQEPAPAEPQQEQAQPQKSQASTAFQKRLEDLESNATYIVEGCCVLSPVRGKHINDVFKGERIMVSLSSNDAMSDKIINAYKARDEDGQALPIPGRVVEKIPNEEGKGVILYVLIAKGIYAKIIEEESVKVETEVTRAGQSDDSSAEDNPYRQKYFNIFIYALFVLLIIAIGVILYMI